MGVRLLKIFLLAALALISITDASVRSRSTLYTGDEIFNLDAILTFFATGDYTTSHFGGYPFDPVISSGPVATWPAGAVLWLGGSLFHARLVSTLLLLAVGVALAWSAARAVGLRLLDAGLFAVGLWASLQFVGGHELRITYPGEEWGLFYLVAGLLLVGRYPHASAFIWGIAAWLCKIIYLPFGAALVAATAVARARERGRAIGSPAALPELARLGVAFAAPLAMWIALIWLRYDAATVAAWARAYVVFVVRHAIGISLGLQPSGRFAGWRFEPDWGEPPPFLSSAPDVTLPTVVPLLTGPVLLGAWIIARRRAARPLSEMERALSIASLAVIAAFAVWFFSGNDPTQWQRHLAPAVYASVALAAYCVLDLARTLRLSPARARALALLACVVLVWTVGNRTLDAVRRWGRQTSYAKACRGRDVLAVPCKQERALAEIATMTHEICGLTDRDLDETCMQQRGSRFVERAMTMAAAAPADLETLYTAAYVAVFVEQWGYSDRDAFTSDLAPLLCARDNPLLWAYFEDAGADVGKMRSGC